MLTPGAGPQRPLSASPLLTQDVCMLLPGLPRPPAAAGPGPSHQGIPKAQALPTPGSPGRHPPHPIHTASVPAWLPAPCSTPILPWPASTP